jgi:hypothetical protein
MYSPRSLRLLLLNRRFRRVKQRILSSELDDDAKERALIEAKTTYEFSYQEILR